MRPADPQKRAELAAEALESLPFVRTADVVSPDEAPTSNWTVDVIMYSGVIPPEVNSILGYYSLATGMNGPQGDWMQVLAVPWPPANGGCTA